MTELKDEMARTSENMHYKAIKAAVRFLERRGCAVFADATEDECHGMDVVFGDDGGDTLHFCRVSVHDGWMPEEGDWDHAGERKRFEAACIYHLAEDPFEECRLQYDRIDVCVLTSDRALLRLHSNALAGDAV